MENMEKENIEVKDNVQKIEAEVKVEIKEKKKKKGIFSILITILSFLLFLYVGFQTVIAFLNFNMIKEDKEPTYFVTKTKEKDENYDYTIYSMGLYKIVRKEDSKRYEIKLLPFFLEP